MTPETLIHLALAALLLAAGAMGGILAHTADFLRWLPDVRLGHFLLESAALFCLGLYAILTRRNAIMLLMGVELVLNAANINFLAFARNGSLNLDGQLAAASSSSWRPPRRRSRWRSC